MTKKETYQLFALLEAVYPDILRGVSEEGAKLKLSVWQEMFADIPGEQVLRAAKAFIASDRKGFPPVPGQILEKLLQLNSGGEITEQEAWCCVARALRNSTYGAEAEFAALPEPIRRAVGSPQVLRNWAQVDVTQVETVIASNFKRDYRRACFREAEYRILPAAVREEALLPGGQGPGFFSEAAQKKSAEALSS